MGIFGLMTYWEKECIGGLEPVKLSEIATQYKNEMKKDPVVLVDISSCITHLVKHFELKELKKLKENLLIFINKCSDLGIKLMFIGDGLKPTYKYNLWKQVQLSYLKGTPVDDRDYFVLYFGWMLQTAVSVFLSTDKCEYVRSIYEADAFIIHYSKTEGCFGILSADTDLFLADGAQYYLSIKHLDINSMTTCHYNRDNLSRDLNISPSQLPIFGALLHPCVGFEYNEKKKQCLKDKTFVSNQFQEVATLIRKLPDDSKSSLEFDGFGLRNNQRQDFEQRLNFFMNRKRSVEPAWGNDMWGEILRLAEERHVAGIADKRILEILVNRVFFLSAKRRTFDLSESWLISLRKQVYGILFFECPETQVLVKEHCIRRLKPKVIEVSFVRRSHCGLLNLWSRDTSPDIVNERRKIFCRALNENLTPKMLQVLDIPEEILFAILTLFCLLSDKSIHFPNSEVKVFLAQAILANKLTAEEIQDYRNLPNTSSLNLCNWFLGTVDQIQLLNRVCGKPYCTFKTNITNFFDGTLYEYFHEKTRNESWRKQENFLPPQENDYLEKLQSKLSVLVNTCKGPRGKLH